MEPFLTFDAFINEVVGAERRCSNNAFASAGLCRNEPIKDLDDIYDALKAMGDYTTYTEKGDKLQHRPDKSNNAGKIGNSEQETIVWDSKARERHEVVRNFITGYGIKTKGVIQYIKESSNAPVGSYFMRVTKHLLVAHKLKDGSVVVVDTQAKFDSGKEVKDIYYVDHHPDTALKSWLEDNPEKAEEIVKRF